MPTSSPVASPSASEIGSGSQAPGPMGTPQTLDMTQVPITNALTTAPSVRMARVGRTMMTTAQLSWNHATTAKNVPCRQLTSKCSPA